MSDSAALAWSWNAKRQPINPNSVADSAIEYLTPKGERKALAGEELEQVPDAPRVLALGRGLHPLRNRPGTDRRKHLREEREVRAVVLERKLKMVAWVVAGPVLRRIRLRLAGGG